MSAKAMSAQAARRAGRDQAGTRTAAIAVAALTLYPDAGHAFLFQDQAAFLPLVESFLG